MTGLNASSVHRTERVSAVFANYPTGVVVLTALSPDGDLSAIATPSFAVASIDPPMVSFAVPKDSAIASAESICVNVLTADQEGLCRRLSAGDDGAVLDEAGWSPARSGAPIIEGAASWMDCRRTAVLGAGSNWLVLAEVDDLDGGRRAMPLMQFQRGYGSFVPGTLVASQGPESFAIAGLAEAARDAIQLLARDLAAECSLIVPMRGESVFVATANYSESTHPTRLGLRSPIVAPLGTLLVGAPGGSTEEQWLSHLDGDSDAEMRTAAIAQLRRAQERQWSISLQGVYALDELDDAVAAYTSPSRTPEDEQHLLDIVRQMSPCHEIADLVPGQRYDLLHLAVPVRNVAGTVVAVLRMSDLPAQAEVDEINFWISQLNDASRRVELNIAAG